MKSDQQLSLCPLQGCAPAPVLAEPQSYKQRRKAVVVSFSGFYLKIHPRGAEHSRFLGSPPTALSPLLNFLGRFVSFVSLFLFPQE